MEVIGVLFLLGGLAGYVLGIVGFFLAMGARRAIAELRNDIALARREAALGMAAAAPASPPPAAEAVTPPLTDITAAPEPEPAIPPPPIQPAPAAEETFTATAPDRATPDIETQLTTRWGVWLGAVALGFAGIFLIRYAVENSLLGPGPRCAMAGLLGLALTAGAEWLRRRQEPQAGQASTGLVDHAPAALAAGGVAVLFGAAYGAGSLYELVPPLAGFVLMALASLAGLLLSLRHGQLVAAVGIIGGFVTPLLVQSDSPSLPGLFLYLLFVTAAALAVVRYSAWIWLGWATTIAGAAWILLIVSSGVFPDAWAAALFVAGAAALHLWLMPPEALEHEIGRRLVWVPLAVLGGSGLLLALAAGTWDTRAGVLALAPLTIWRAGSEPRLRLLPHLAALLFLLLLLIAWPLNLASIPDIGGFPGLRPPEDVGALLGTAAIMSAVFAAGGSWFERRTPCPLPWASLPAAVPVLALLIGYTRVAGFHPRVEWAAVALLLGAALTGAAAMAAREDGDSSRARAGVHAAGAVAALALGCAMLLADHWLSLAVALFLPALAWIEARADLPPLRRVAIAVAAVVLVRLLGNVWVLGYAFGALPIANGLLAAYGVPAAAFAVAAAMFHRRGDDMAVAVLELGAAALATALVVLEIRHYAGGGDLTRVIGFFAELALDAAALTVMTLITLRIAARLDRPLLVWAWRAQGLAALVCGSLLLLFNPAVTNAPVGNLPILDWLLPAYLIPALGALAVSRRPGAIPDAPMRAALAGYTLVAGFAWISLQIRHLFHGPQIGLAEVPIDTAELWTLSAGWLAYGGLLLGLGIWRGSRAARLTALAVIGLAAAKVFLVDMSGLEGLWRVGAFLGLGLVLIGLSQIYRRFVAPPRGNQSA